MKSIKTKHILLSTLLLTGLTTCAFAQSDSTLPQSVQVTQNLNETNSSKSIEIVPEIVIQTGDTNQSTNRGLKEGEACEDTSLEPAELGPDDYSNIPMAKTISCDTVNCKGLDAAKLLKDTYRKIPMAKTTKLKPCRK